MNTVGNDGTVALEERIRRVLAIHFDPEQGAPFWIAKAEHLGFHPAAEIHRVADLARFPAMDPKELAALPFEALLPRTVLSRRAELVIAQTSGTLGRPAWTAYLEREFHAAFVEPFVVAASHLGFPVGGTWLYVGPSGPHIIGRAADAIARAMGGAMPFTVDFDPRWARKLKSGSFAAQRYLHHVVAQSLEVLDGHEITVLFSTPVVIRTLAQAMHPDQRRRIRGVHYGGMAIAPEEMKLLQSDVFPEAVHLSGYGNTLFGCSLELNLVLGRELKYFPHGDRLLFGVWGQGGDDGGGPMYGRVGSEGPLVFSRLDETVLLLNVVERDAVRLCEPPADAPAGFGQMGVASPVPRMENRSKVAVSLY